MQKIYLVFLMLASLSVFADGKINPVKAGALAFEHQGNNLLAITFENVKKWHTYWKNPGDAGTEIKIKFLVDGKPTELKEYPWPAPKRYIEQGDMWAYGYGKRYALFFGLNDGLKNKKLEVDAQWLVCKDICIPGEQKFTITIDQDLKGQSTPVLSKSELSTSFDKLPKAGAPKFDFYLNKAHGKDNMLALNYVIENADYNEVSEESSIVYPYLQFPFDYKHEEIHFDKKNNMIYGRIYIDWDGIFEEPVMELPKNGIFDKPIKTSFLVRYPLSQNGTIVTKTFTQFSLNGDKAMTELFASLESAPKPKKEESSLILILLFGFLGGLILNLMPCVLPVISLKLFGLVAHSNESKASILKHNLAYTAGVLSSFMVLAGVILAIKSSGTKIGWGFQLQSPLFVFMMLILIFILALNMLGLFEFVTPGGRVLGSTEIKKGMGGDFVNGILATILSTPCSAPFLGSALTYAFTTNAFNTFIVFISIGIGLSFPFLLTGFFPKLIRFLPKPGAWMEKLKNILGLTLLLTVVWLYDVLDGLIDLEFAGLYINTILVLIFFGFFFRKNISKNPFMTVLLFAIPILLLGQSIKINAFDVSEGSSTINARSQWKRWSPQAAKKAPGPTFINFTAKWCLTCKVNKKLVLESEDFSKLVAREKITLLEGDWTKRDPDITTFLESHNIVGVPAYFIKTKAGEIKSLGETISISKIKKNLK